MIDLLILLAFKLGKKCLQVSLLHILGLTKLSVNRYLDLLKKVFIIINVRGFSRNLRYDQQKMD